MTGDTKKHRNQHFDEHAKIADFITVLTTTKESEVELDVKAQRNGPSVTMQKHSYQDVHYDNIVHNNCRSHQSYSSVNTDDGVFSPLNSSVTEDDPFSTAFDEVLDCEEKSLLTSPGFLNSLSSMDMLHKDSISLSSCEAEISPINTDAQNCNVTSVARVKCQGIDVQPDMLSKNTKLASESNDDAHLLTDTNAILHDGNSADMFQSFGNTVQTNKKNNNSYTEKLRKGPGVTGTSSNEKFNFSNLLQDSDDTTSYNNRVVEDLETDRKTSLQETIKGNELPNHTETQVQASGISSSLHKKPVGLPLVTENVTEMKVHKEGRESLLKMNPTTAGEREKTIRTFNITSGSCETTSNDLLNTSFKSFPHITLDSLKNSKNSEVPFSATQQNNYVLEKDLAMTTAILPVDESVSSSVTVGSCQCVETMKSSMTTPSTISTITDSVNGTNKLKSVAISYESQSHGSTVNSKSGNVVREGWKPVRRRKAIFEKYCQQEGQFHSDQNRKQRPRSRTSKWSPTSERCDASLPSVNSNTSYAIKTAPPLLYNEKGMDNGSPPSLPPMPENYDDSPPLFSSEYKFAAAFPKPMDRTILCHSTFEQRREKELDDILHALQATVKKMEEDCCVSNSMFHACSQSTKLLEARSHCFSLPIGNFCKLLECNSVDTVADLGSYNIVVAHN